MTHKRLSCQEWHVSKVHICSISVAWKDKYVLSLWRSETSGAVTIAMKIKLGHSCITGQSFSRHVTDATPILFPSPSPYPLLPWEQILHGRVPCEALGRPKCCHKVPCCCVSVQGQRWKWTCKFFTILRYVVWWLDYTTIRMKMPDVLKARASMTFLKWSLCWVLVDVHSTHFLSVKIR